MAVAQVHGFLLGPKFEMGFAHPACLPGLGLYRFNKKNLK